MPAKSKAQQRLMQAAEHGADFAMARRLRDTMTHQQLHDFAVGSENGKPEHVRKGLDAARRSHPHAARLGKFLHPKKGR